MAVQDLTDSTGMTRHFGDSSRLNQYTNSTSANLTEAISTASAMAAEALYARYTAASVDALTASTCPKDLQHWIECLVAEILTAGGKGRTEDMQQDAIAARGYLSAVRRGEIDVPGLTEVGSSQSGGSGSGSVRWRGPEEREFDRDNTSQNYAARFPRI